MREWGRQRSRILANRQEQASVGNAGCLILGAVTLALIAGSIYEGRPPTFVENFDNWFYHNIWYIK